MAKFKSLYLTVPSDSNIAVFEDDVITDTSIVEFYTDDNNIYPIAMSQSGNTVNVTLSNHTSDVHCCLTVNNISEFETPLNADDIVYNDTTVYYELMEHRFELNQIINAIGNLDTAINSKQDILIPGDNITIEDNVISASGGSGDIIPSGNIQNTSIYEGGASDDYTYTVDEDGYYVAIIRLSSQSTGNASITINDNMSLYNVANQTRLTGVHVSSGLLHLSSGCTIRVVGAYCSIYKYTF